MTMTFVQKIVMVEVFATLFVVSASVTKDLLEGIAGGSPALVTARIMVFATRVVDATVSKASLVQTALLIFAQTNAAVWASAV